MNNIFYEAERLVNGCILSVFFVTSFINRQNEYISGFFFFFFLMAFEVCHSILEEQISGRGNSACGIKNDMDQPCFTTFRSY